jgi:PPK2 family polyphosphate:nucleotide phosphotransferase
MKAIREFRASEDLKLHNKGAHGEEPPPKDMLEAILDEISGLQEKLYAGRQRKLLIVLQGVDTSGKDGTVRSLSRRINPMGLRVTSFAAPTAIEAAHDFLWRIHREVPKAGQIAIFNRSHYEDVLVPLVNGDITRAECKRRYAQIRDFERMLADSGTTLLKFFLHISKDEQRARLQDRLDDPDKQWKFDPDDMEKREKWKQYQRAYEDAIKATDAGHAPWFIVPADSKAYRNFIVARVVLETMRAMRLQWPEPDSRLDGFKIR